MTLLELTRLMDRNPFPVIAYFVTLPALLWTVARVRGWRSPGDSPVRWLYSAVLYGVSVPALFSALMLVDGVSRRGVAGIELVSQLIPLVSVAAIFVVLGRGAVPEEIPGLSRMKAFVWVLLLTGLALFLVMRTRLWIVFGGGMGALAVVGMVIFLMLQWGWRRAFGRRDF